MKDRGQRSYQRDDVDPYKDYSDPITSGASNSTPKAGSKNECENLNFSTQLQDVLETINNVKLGDRLPIILSRDKILNVYNKDGKICSKIIGPLMKDLISCIEKGNSFVAVVINKTGIVCNVQVEIA